MKKDEIRKTVREEYAKVARGNTSCCGGSSSCCGQSTAQEISKDIGYSDEEMNTVPEGANLGLGCGNPTAMASIKEGETVLDLGSGAGFDCFLAANRVGKRGHVIGVDMTPDMLEKARANARKGGYDNIEFRLGEIENLPVADNSADVIISNCVINLSPDKTRVFEEAYRVLKPGGRLLVSDIVLLGKLPDFVRESVVGYVGCISGAILKKDYISAIEGRGFRKVDIVDETPFPIDCMANDPTAQAIIKENKTTVAEIRDIENSVVSVKISAVKPAKL
ncbi:MAG TPA: arsenite S-adenosylmethyltransferase [Dehalococcoidia bacterium]|nr:arsenite S-adenosylmethyltransferase [Dehalococcoidia bacterium]